MIFKKASALVLGVLLLSTSAYADSDNVTVKIYDDEIVDKTPDEIFRMATNRVKPGEGIKLKFCRKRRSGFLRGIDERCKTQKVECRGAVFGLFGKKDDPGCWNRNIWNTVTFIDEMVSDNAKRADDKLDDARDDRDDAQKKVNRNKARLSSAEAELAQATEEYEQAVAELEAIQEGSTENNLEAISAKEDELKDARRKVEKKQDKMEDKQKKVDDRKSDLAKSEERLEEKENELVEAGSNLRAAQRKKFSDDLSQQILVDNTLVNNYIQRIENYRVALAAGQLNEELSNSLKPFHGDCKLGEHQAPASSEEPQASSQEQEKRVFCGEIRKVKFSKRKSIVRLKFRSGESREVDGDEVKTKSCGARGRFGAAFSSITGSCKEKLEYSEAQFEELDALEDGSKICVESYDGVLHSITPMPQ